MKFRLELLKSDYKKVIDKSDENLKKNNTVDQDAADKRTMHLYWTAKNVRLVLTCWKTEHPEEYSHRRRERIPTQYKKNPIVAENQTNKLLAERLKMPTIPHAMIFGTIIHPGMYKKQFVRMDLVKMTWSDCSSKCV